MGILLISIAVIGATLIWPVNRWVMHNGGKLEVYGFWFSISAAFVSGSAALMLKQSLCQPTVWLIGVLIGFAFATGYCIIIMYCLRIGPVGPTVAMNNMGMVWPVVLGAVWLKVYSFNEWIIIGVVLVIISIVFFSLSKEGLISLGQTSRITRRWVLWVFLGWLLAGISMTGQLFASIYYTSGRPFALVFVFTTTSAVILAPLVIRRGKTCFSRKEMLPGMINGVLLAVIGAATLAALEYHGPEIVFPFIVAAPVILILILGKFLYGERLDKPRWLACFFCMGGLVSLSVSQVL